MNNRTSIAVRETWQRYRVKRTLSCDQGDSAGPWLLAGAVISATGWVITHLEADAGVAAAAQAVGLIAFAVGALIASAVDVRRREIGELLELTVSAASIPPRQHSRRELDDEPSRDTDHFVHQVAQHVAATHPDTGVTALVELLAATWAQPASDPTAVNGRVFCQIAHDVTGSSRNAAQLLEHAANDPHTSRPLLLWAYTRTADDVRTVIDTIWRNTPHDWQAAVALCDTWHSSAAELFDITRQLQPAS